jgi:hypothetical protein
MPGIGDQTAGLNGTRIAGYAIESFLGFYFFIPSAAGNRIEPLRNLNAKRFTRDFLRRGKGVDK